MQWERMSIDEYARLETAYGGKLERVDGVWWKECRPFFYRPLFPFAAFDPGRASAPALARLCGYQHPVRNGGPANSHVNYFLCDTLGYSLDALSRNRRKKIRRALKQARVERISDFDVFVEQGYRVYLSFYERTRYAWRKDRVRKESFVAWAESVFAFPKLMILGVFSGEGLAAIDIAFRVEDLVIDAAFMSSSEHLHLKPSDLASHFLREETSRISGARYIFSGTYGTKPGIDRHMLDQGCKVLTLPARCKLMPGLGLLLRAAGPRLERRVKGFSRAELEALVGRDRLLSSAPSLG